MVLIKYIGIIFFAILLKKNKCVTYTFDTLKSSSTKYVILKGLTSTPTVAKCVTPDNEQSQSRIIRAINNGDGSIYHKINFVSSSDFFFRLNINNELKVYRIYTDSHHAKSQLYSNVEDHFYKFSRYKIDTKIDDFFEVKVNGIVLKSTGHNSVVGKKNAETYYFNIPKFYDKNFVYEINFDVELPLYEFHPDVDYLKPSHRYNAYGIFQKSAGSSYIFINHYPYKSDLCYYEYKKNGNGEPFQSLCNQHKCINLCQNLKLKTSEVGDNFASFRIKIVGQTNFYENTYDKFDQLKYNDIVSMKEDRIILKIFSPTASITCDKLKLLPFEYKGPEEALQLTRGACSISKRIVNGNFVVKYDFDHANSYFYLINLSNEPFKYETIDGVNAVHIFYHEEFHFGGNNRSSEAKTDNEETICHVLISEENTQYFFDAVCDLYGSFCYDRCDGSFTILNLKRDKSYQFKIVPLGFFNEFISSNTISLKNQFNPSIAFKNDAGLRQVILLFSKSRTNVELTNGLTCLVVIREKISSTTMRYFQICKENIFCIVPCNHIIHKESVTTDYLIYSIKIPGMMKDFVDVQQVIYQAQDIQYRDINQISVTYNIKKYSDIEKTPKKVIEEAEIAYTKFIFKNKYPYESYREPKIISHALENTNEALLQYSSDHANSQIQTSNGFIKIDKNNKNEPNLDDTNDKKKPIPPPPIPNNKNTNNGSGNKNNNNNNNQSNNNNNNQSNNKNNNNQSNNKNNNNQSNNNNNTGTKIDESSRVILAIVAIIGGITGFILWKKKNYNYISQI